jgi:hypothetical protein
MGTAATEGDERAPSEEPPDVLGPGPRSERVLALIRRLPLEFDGE